MTCDDDFQLFWDSAWRDGVFGDWSLAAASEPGNAGGLSARNPLHTAVILSLFTDARAGEDDVTPDGTGDRRGWPGDGFDVREDLGEAPLGSRLWLLRRAQLTAETARRAEDMAHEALAPLVRQGACARVVAEAEVLPQAGRLDLAVRLLSRDGQTIYDQRFQRLWEMSRNAV